MVKHDPARGALRHEFEPGNRKNARRPIACSPSLDNPYVWHKLDLPSGDESAEKRNRASHFATYLGGLIRQVHRLQGPAELYDAGKLFGVRKSVVHALRACREYRLLVYRIRGM